MKKLLYPVLRLFRKVVFWASKGGAREYNDKALALSIALGDLNLWNSGGSAECILSKDFLQTREFFSEDTPVSVLDFGGGGGRHGFELSRSKSVEWIVVETPALAAAATETLSVTGISFVSSIERAKALASRFWMVHVSSSLQYTPSPRAFLDELLELEANFIVFEKLVLTSGPKAITFQQYSFLGDNTSAHEGFGSWFSGAKYPLTAMPYLEFVERLEHAYDVVSHSVDTLQSHLPLFKGLTQHSFIAKRRSI